MLNQDVNPGPLGDQRSKVSVTSEANIFYKLKPQGREEGLWIGAV